MTTADTATAKSPFVKILAVLFCAALASGCDIYKSPAHPAATIAIYHPNGRQMCSSLIQPETHAVTKGPSLTVTMTPKSLTTKSPDFACKTSWKHLGRDGDADEYEFALTSARTGQTVYKNVRLESEAVELLSEEGYRIVLHPESVGMD